MPREWAITQQGDLPSALREAVGGHPLVANLLASRGIADPYQARAYLDPACYVPGSPYELSGMTVAVKLIQVAITNGERLRIWGDFDTDGQTATALLYEALVAAGARVDWQVPRRQEGHGFHARAITDALRHGVSLIITCDTGIGEVEVVQRGIREGLKIIVTDHHDLPQRLPPAQAVIDSKMLPPDHRLRELTGVGVTYMVARALLEGSDQAQVLEEMLDLVALGLVADMAVQVADVRYLIQRGLVALRQGKRPGLRALVGVAGLDLAYVDELSIGYQLGPRLNAAGRLADAELAIRLLLTHDEAEGRELAERLEVLNRERQALTEALTCEVEERLRRDREMLRRPAIVLDGENWEPGILGLVAGELARRYDRPAIMVAHLEGQPSASSARSVPGIDIHEAIASQRKHLLREGGHPMAAGFTIERDKLSAFRVGLWDWLERTAPPREAAPSLGIDAEVPWQEVGLDLARELARLSPFGVGNPRPVLVTGGGTLSRVEDVSRRRETRHRHLYLDNDMGRHLRFTWFDAEELPHLGERLDIAFYPTLGHWRGKERLELELVDWRLSQPAVSAEVATLIAGRQVVDWRLEANVDGLLDDLRAMQGEGLLIWAEGLGPTSPDGRGRHEMEGRRTVALAILTPPPGPEALRWVLSQVRPQLVYLLPPREVREPTPREFLTQVAGMLRMALRAHDGVVDTLRMASRVGSRQAAVVAALRGLEARGKIVLHHEADGMRAYRPDAVPAEEYPQDADAESDAECAARRHQAEQQARQALLYLLAETRAYRQAYTTEAVGALFHAGR